MSSKACSKCNVVKELAEFYNDRARNDGKRTTCKTCEALAYKIRYGGQYVRARRDLPSFNPDYWHLHAEQTLKRIKATKAELELVRNTTAMLPEMVRLVNRSRLGQGDKGSYTASGVTTPSDLIDAFSERRRRSGHGPLHWKRKIHLMQATLDFHRAEYGAPPITERSK